MPVSIKPLRRPAAALITAVAVLVVAEKLTLRLPAVPYNVSELFLNNGNIPALTFFALTLLWLGAGAMLIARLVSANRRPYLALPVTLVCVSLLSKMLVSRGVTYESLDDILGANNLFGLVTSQHIWGPAWQNLFLRVGVDTVDFIERRVRYCALYSLPTVCAALAFMSIAGAVPVRRRRSAVSLALCAIVGVAWVLVAGAVVLTGAATDNLTELIASSGPLGLPGWVFLFAAMLLVGYHAAVLRHAMRSRVWAFGALGASAAAVPLSWWLVNAGLEQHVVKYGLVFPATQFLLGPDRQHLLPRGVLMGRWTVVYLFAVATVTVGAWLFDAFVSAGAAISERPATALEVS